MANFIGMVFATLKKEGIDTSNMSVEDAIEKYNELQHNSKPLTNNKKSGIIYLPKQEYAPVCSAINQKNARYKDKRPERDSILYGNYKYYYKNGKDFGDFEIIRKTPIVSKEWRVKNDRK